MARITRIAGVLAIAAVLAAGRSAELGAAPPGPDPSPDVKAQIERGDLLFEEGKRIAARKAYQKAIEIAREEGELPEEAVRRLANAYYFDGQFRRAAKALDRLAEEAALHGDLPVQAWALADAAWLYGRAGDEASVKTRLEAVERLLASPYMPEAVRDRIEETRLGESVEDLVSRR